MQSKRLLLGVVLGGISLSAGVGAVRCYSHRNDIVVADQKEIVLNVNGSGDAEKLLSKDVLANKSVIDVPTAVKDSSLQRDRVLNINSTKSKEVIDVHPQVTVETGVNSGNRNVEAKYTGITKSSVQTKDKSKAIRSGHASEAKKPNLTTDDRFQVEQIIAQITKDRRAHALRPQVLKLAIVAYQRSTKMGIKPNKPIITLIDYSLPSVQKRLWVIDLERRKILFCSLVAHGKNSGKSRYARTFSNRNGSLMSSLGVFMTEDTYFGKDGYSLRLQGLERGVNDNAKKRYIVMHGSPYVSEWIAAKTGRVGCSWGCPAVEPHLAKPIINTIKGGSLIFSFYPDSKWLKHSPFLHS